MVNGIAAFDLGEARVTSPDQSTDDEDVVPPAVYFELGYTMADAHTPFYLEHQAEDYLDC